MGEELDRLEAMIADDHWTWDLSPKDVRAIRWAIDQIKAARTPGPDVSRLLAAAKYALPSLDQGSEEGYELHDAIAEHEAAHPA